MSTKLLEFYKEKLKHNEKLLNDPETSDYVKEQAEKNLLDLSKKIKIIESSAEEIEFSKTQIVQLIDTVDEIVSKTKFQLFMEKITPQKWKQAKLEKDAEFVIADSQKNILKREDLSKGATEVLGILSKLKKIEEKNNCLRVRILDSIANFIEKHAMWLVNKLRNHAMKISTPCAIKIPVKKEKKYKGW